jgi:raffinose/stachyose/melibiose transport system substrate-binding protein
MNRRKCVAILTAAAALGLAGCSSSGSGGSGSVSSAASKTLVVQTTSYYSAYEMAVGKLLQKQNPGLKITYQQVSAQQEISTNLQVLASNSAPDVGDAPINGNVYPVLVKAGELLPLTDVWSAANLDAAYGSSLAGSLKVNGTPYVVDYSNVLYGFAWYSEDIFAKLHIPAPVNHTIPTMAALLKITNELRAGGYQPLLIPGGGEQYWNWMVDAFLPTSATPAEYQNYLTNFNPKVPVTTSYADPEFAAVFNRLKVMYDEKMFQDGVIGMNNASTQALFASGKAGMIMGHALTPDALDTLAKTKLSLNWVLLPPINPAKKSLPIVYNGNTFVIPKNAHNPAMAKKYLELMMSPQMQEQISTLAGGAEPAIKLPTPTSDPYGLLKFVAANGDYVGWAAVTPGALNQVDSEVQAVETGKQTAQQVGKEIDAERDKIRAGGS